MTATMARDDAASVLRARLEARLVELQARVASTLVTETETAAGAGEVRDAGDEAVVIENTDVRTALLQRDAHELNELQSALVRIDGGNYGECVECGLDIEPARLRALPTARRCSACQEVFEHRAALTAPR
jgi:DnaK suppressor protein